MFFVAMGSHADDIVGEYFEAEDWGTFDDEVETELDLSPQTPHESDA